jgi:hypothetical protein
MGESEAKVQRLLHQQRCRLVSTVCVLFEDGGMVHVRAVTALNHHRHQVLQLTPGIPRVEDMLLRLCL